MNDNVWKNDEELFTVLRREIYTAVVGDILDKEGYFHQFLPPEIKPLKRDMMLVGRAMTVLETDIFGETHGTSKNPVLAKPFGLMLEALDDLLPGEVYVCTGASPSYALWGELMTARASFLKAGGVVLNGYTRDTRETTNGGFPIFSFGGYAQDQGPRGKVIDYRVPIEIGKVKIDPGDLVIGDMDGVCIVPKSIEEDIIIKALENARDERMVRKAIISGMSAVESFEEFGIM
ncbi:MAG: RraA family protein [Cytophagales bacterium]|nr:RraA family protein [Cytophagales bacterium]